ncbi:MAG: DUF1707 domain-containing protein [Pseudomonadota bacterium]
MAVKFEDRPIEQVREETIDQLVMNYSHGIISAQAFERRLDQAMDATDNQLLAELVSDLELETDTTYTSMKEQQFAPHYGEGRVEPTEKVISILSSNERSGHWTVPREITVYSLLGSVELDFSDAVFQHPSVTIKLIGALSSVELFVPEEVTTSSNVFNILGSVENKVSASGRMRQAPHIEVVGTQILGSIEVKVRRTMREKFLSFANSVKSAFNSN